MNYRVDVSRYGPTITIAANLDKKSADDLAQALANGGHYTMVESCGGGVCTGFSKQAELESPPIEPELKILQRTLIDRARTVVGHFRSAGIYRPSAHNESDAMHRLCDASDALWHYQNSEGGK